ncbi:K02221 YggT family protein [Streptococcus dysgalactiae subsp. equisimilis AC-2713]|uniref:K02221 YggT family protein n=1 Tax=Streptococcus dysgalactiae subsp. equisimilis AC-2713 TaxID=759913 RepID=A0AB33R907_STREQ|nr:YggT family protein [Streptococcus dysgalactiae]QJD62266.1 YggT family protein [Streptococcus dysgalactiae subsp. equisimilis]QJD64207.1 YggT family protein [Streptococcus dysgalactiae subsp. equisimilis]QJR39612.1 YggT family protein [Streptococcus dysgalactiae subsp. equisimilis]CCI63106.1 K02221 YggT family protein [Streptococcus dysgalactiae subsp. equisimilis AC-2713]
MILILPILLRLIRVYSYLLIAYALLSWFPGAYNSWIGRLLSGIVEPVLKPFRALNLQFAGLDFTIFVIIIGLNFLAQILVRVFI